MDKGGANLLARLERATFALVHSAPYRVVTVGGYISEERTESLVKHCLSLPAEGGDRA